MRSTVGIPLLPAQAVAEGQGGGGCQGVKGFVAELDESDATIIASVKSIKGGKKQGTYATELVALRYAGFNPKKAKPRAARTGRGFFKNERKKAVRKVYQYHSMDASCRGLLK